MSDVLEQAKALFDKELDDATAEIIKRWEAVYKKQSNTKSQSLDKVLKAIKNGCNHARRS